MLKKIREFLKNKMPKSKNKKILFVEQRLEALEKRVADLESENHSMKELLSNTNELLKDDKREKKQNIVQKWLNGYEPEKSDSSKY